MDDFQLLPVQFGNVLILWYFVGVFLFCFVFVFLWWGVHFCGIFLCFGLFQFG